jgi:hypothetical protein
MRTSWKCKLICSSLFCSIETCLNNWKIMHRYDENDMTEGGKRASTWAMLSNKGLTPKRKKIDRNPRVKKRVKYEKSMKRLGSVRAVVKDRKTLPAYDGERTGIKSGIAKSVKFNF